MRGDQQVERERDDMGRGHSVDALQRRRSFGSLAGWCGGYLGKLTDSPPGKLPGAIAGSMKCSSTRLATSMLTLLVAITVMTVVVAKVDSETDAFPVAIPVEASSLASSSLPPRCALQFAAVLDLAELERSYGKTSGAYRQAFGNVSGKIHDCRANERYAAASPEAGHGGGSKPGLT